ncbi:MAG: hypothetical protein ACREBQ_03370 [Nitrososphaerales archaeon]
MTALQTSPPQVSWWLDHFAVPILFTLFGAILGFAAGWLREWLEDRKARTAFLKAIRMEVQTLHEQVKGSLKDALENKAYLDWGGRQVVHLVSTFQTSIYSSQLSKLKNLADPLVYEVVRLYTNLSNLEIVKSHIASRSFELMTLQDNEAGKEAGIVTIYRSALDEVIKRMNAIISAAESLIPKLPN